MVILACYLLGIAVGVSGTLFFLLAYVNRTIQRAVDLEFVNLEPMFKDMYESGYALGKAHALETRPQ